MARRSEAAVQAPSNVAAAWIPDRIEQRPVGELRPAENNPRKHPRAQIEQLAERYRQGRSTSLLDLTPC
jgi:hypothetical protein